MSGGLRVIEGGRGDESSPGLLIVGAAEVATMAGGVRAGLTQGHVGRLTDGRRRRPGAARMRPVVACWEGRIAAVGPRSKVEAALEAEGYPLGRFVRVDADGGVVTPGLIDPHTHLLFGGSRETRTDPAPAGRQLHGDPGGRRRDPLDGRRDAARRMRTTLAAHGRRWLDEMLGHGVTTIEAKSGYGLDLETEIRLLEVAWQLGREGPIEIVPTFLGAHAVPPEFRVAAGRRRGLRPFRHRGPAARGRGARPRPVLRRLLRDRCLHRGPVAPDPRRRRRRTG